MTLFLPGWHWTRALNTTGIELFLFATLNSAWPGAVKGFFDKVLWSALETLPWFDQQPQHLVLDQPFKARGSSPPPSSGLWSQRREWRLQFQRGSASSLGQETNWRQSVISQQPTINTCPARSAQFIFRFSTSLKKNLNSLISNPWTIKKFLFCFIHTLI